MEKCVTARILSGVGGLYTVQVKQPDADTPAQLRCPARGVFRHDDKKPLTGDLVTVRLDTGAPAETAVIREILPRRCALIRPPLANVTHLFVILAAAKPCPVTETVDKLLAIAVHNGICPGIVITKSDLAPEEAENYAAIYRKAGFPVYLSSPDDPEVTVALKAALNALPDGSLAAFAGASGVGKSTLLNRLFPGLGLATGEISRRIDRGRHTTRRVDLYPVDPARPDGALFADTPGFSLLDFARFDFFALEDLFDSYPDFAPYAGQCRYADCTHTGEGAADCAIARAEAEGLIAPSRHASYRALYRILNEKKNNYD